MKKPLLIVVAIIVIALAVLAAYMGVFTSVQVEERMLGPFTLVYREMNANNLKLVGEITDSLSAILAAKKIESRKPLDVFYPDGHAEIGFAVEGYIPEQIAFPADVAKVRTISAQQCMAVTFPWRNPLSFIVGYMKVDPALAKHRKERGYAQSEAYSLNNGDTITYFQPIVK